MFVGVSMVKWTTLDPCTSLGESDSKCYINFQFYDEKKSYTFNKHIDL